MKFVHRSKAVLRSRGARIAAVLLVAAVGAWLGIFLSGTVRAQIGPVETGMSLRPAWDGETVVDASPLGTLTFQTHSAPLRLRITLENIDQERAKSLLEDPRIADRLPDVIEQDLLDGVRALVIRSLLCAGAGALIAVLMVFRRPRTALMGLLAASVALAATGALAAVTFRPSSLVEPRYSGLVAAAPSLVGSAESIVTRFESYRSQLTKLVTNVSKLYDTVSTLPLYDADPKTIRVLHISDIHLNPIAWNVIRSLKDQFAVDLVIDTGDISDHGTKAENKFVDEIRTLQVPYVFVRGNHDSMTTQKAVEKQKNAIVLDDTAQQVAGLTIYGLGDPRFTPDKSVSVDSDPAALAEYGRAHRAKVGKADLIAVHDGEVGNGFSGAAPMILAGHTHERRTTVFPTGTRMLIQGSTGGAGLRALEHAAPTPVQASVLYFDRETRRLQAWDDITLGGLGEQSVYIQRHVEPDPQRMISPEPTNAPSPTGSVTGTPASPAAGPPLWHQGQSSPMLQRSPTEGDRET
ncbi:metallophosphoesterase family protein [Nonomuraea gerenzanensis]|uniref:metallophosphoesterase family protein n=1 Tax=Nonomuraea gerenzanensis TaxID=93944 RepID=UPI001CD9AEE6|nr:metallophosphoesterase [Nonomuraea gerenzanensis]UBU12897.1 metallophosphoesterase [Nonomuraea gerenzanensis]